MQGDDVGLFERLAQVCCYRLRDEGVAYAMKPVLAQLVLVGNGLVDWVGAYVVWERIVEG